MKNKNATKRSLGAALLCLLLCVAMLIGTTYAWFTDSATTGINTIQSGTLKIKMSYSDRLGGAYTDVEAASAAIFDYEKWEPGYTELRYIKLENTGNLAFKYALDIIPQSAPIADAAELAEVLEVSYAIAPAAEISERDLSGMTAAGTLDTILYKNLDFASGVLLPVGEVQTGVYTGEVTIAIAIKMKESAGNEYQNKSVGGGFTVRALATQYTYETDSIDHQYDANAGFITFDANGGSGIMSLYPITLGEAAALPYNKFTQPDSSFTGWNTKPDGSGTAYANGAEINVSESTILYAQWSKVINNAILTFSNAALPAELIGGATIPDPAGTVTVPAENTGVTLLFNANLWVESDTASPFGGSAVSPGGTFTAGKHYFICAMLDADVKNGFSFENNPLILDNESYEYFTERLYYPNVVDEVRAYRYIGQAK